MNGTSLGVIIEFPNKNHPHLVLATATGATASKEFIYDVILEENRNEFIYDVILEENRKEFIYDVILLEYLATGCYSSQGVYL